MMQIHGPTDCLTAEDIRAYVNSPGFTVLQFGPIAFYLDDPQQCDWLIIAATEAKQLLIDNPAKPEADEPQPEPKPPALMCECGHFEAYHVGAVLGDDKPGQCTAMVDDGGDCGCERYRPAAGQGGVLFNVGDEDDPCSPDAAEALIDAIVAGTPVKPAEGWSRIIPPQKKSHYFVKGRSLCGRYGFPPEPLNPDDYTSSDDCAGCRKKLTLRQLDRAALAQVSS